MSWIATKRTGVSARRSWQAGCTPQPPTPLCGSTLSPTPLTLLHQTWPVHRHTLLGEGVESVEQIVGNVQCRLGRLHAGEPGHRVG